MNKFQKVVSKMVIQDEKEKFWEGYEYCMVGRSIPSSIRRYVKGFKENNYTIEDVYNELKLLKNN
ncbi:TPA: hypothetical protein KOR49_002234 [Clostridioides difficile]|uniref:Uncharacterized protein n=1 Tax=Clostridioides difficile TaxID=1496 RepID=A0AAN6A7W4_CLODI|nr:hypothetical protein [Clostridioides difficile]EGT3944788.1 hypothetical protein [Clostridioides difficile]MBG0197905.1 hypothetical protein [Clostridioides difficile]MCA0574430.1 hypothetical protein [Clostridioides difficile]MDW0077024.1 hypothetical protein [Clostridioides difficile]PBG23750.1 hypothetical protein BGU81_18700 [Clostridioides difficile]